MQNLKKTVEHLIEAEKTICLVDEKILPTMPWAQLHCEIFRARRALENIMADAERKRKEETTCTAT